MLTLEQARERIFNAIVASNDPITVPLLQAVGRYCAGELPARVDNPAFDNSAMDGYAVSAGDCGASRVCLPVHGEASCGDAPGILQPGSAMRIFTGAPLPRGADAVVIQEDVQLRDGKVCFSGPVAARQNCRLRGEDYHAGAVLFADGHRLRAFDLALLAANGYSEVPVWRPPRVLVIATGNELVAAGGELAPGQIYESNRQVTLALLQAQGAQVEDGGIVADDVAALRAVFATAGDYDFVITSGGASVGDHDLVKQVFAELGNIDLWRIRIKPGKPLAFGRLGERTHFFALPGNPLSSLITFQLFVQPALTAWQHGQTGDVICNATALNGFQREPGRREFVRARLSTRDGDIVATALTGQGSHMMGPLRQTNGLIILAEERAGFAAGESVPVMPLAWDSVAEAH